MDNDRRKIELMNSLLLSFPGYADHLLRRRDRMGDNIYLGDRNGVRTPMQWTPDRTAIFPRRPGGFTRLSSWTPLWL